MFTLLSISSLIRRSFLTIGGLSLVSLGSMAITPAQAALINGSFETNDFTGWMTTGDVSIQGNFQGFEPTNGSFQALLTTASTTLPDDGADIAPGAYNFSGTPATIARLNDPALQNFLGLPATALNIGVGNQPYEGSAIKQSISAVNPFEISFDWGFLTNDGEAPLGARDAAFVTLYNINSPQESRTINIVEQSSGEFPDSLNPPTFAKASDEPLKFKSGTLAAGDYILGVGIYDVAGLDKTSALLVDNFQERDVTIPEHTSTISFVVVGCLGLILKGKFFR